MRLLLPGYLLTLILLLSCSPSFPPYNPNPHNPSTGYTIIIKPGKGHNPYPNPTTVKHFISRFKNPSEQEIVIETGDTLTINFISHPKFTQDVEVQPDGAITIKDLGIRVMAKGVTVSELKTKLEKAASVYLRRPEITVSLKTAKRYVTIISKTLKSGKVELTGDGTLLETLAIIGWQYSYEHPRKVTIFRGKATGTIDLAMIVEFGLPDLNIKLQHNDIIVLLETLPFKVVGCVGKPGEYPVPYKGYATLKEAIVLAGGVTKDADLSGIEIHTADGQIIKITDANPYLFGRVERDIIQIKPGDTIYVPEAKEMGVYVFGMVDSPGQVRSRKPISLSQALAIARPSKFGAALSEVKVIRDFPDTPKIMTFNIDRLIAGDRTQDIQLVDGDVVYVPETGASKVLEFLSKAAVPLSSITKTMLDSVMVWSIITTIRERRK